MDYIVLGYLFILSVMDIRSKKVPLIALIFPLAAAIVYGFCTTGFWNLVLGIMPGILLCVLSVCFPKSLGLGDGLLGIICGALYGWRRTCMWFLFGLTMAAAFGICRVIWHRRTESMPLIPFLTIIHIGALLK